MSLFLYKVKNDVGRTLVGLTEAANEKEIKTQFRESTDLYFLSAQLYDVNNLSKIRLKSDDLLMFTNRLYHLIEAGLPILQAFYILWKQSEQEDMQIITSHIRKKLEDGSTLQEAFNPFVKTFPHMYIALIGVAEIGAGLVKILKKLTEHLEDQKKFVSRLKRATIYPLFVLGFAFLILMGMFIFVIPMFEKVILSLHAELPTLTAMLFAFSNLMRNVYFLLFMVALGVGGFFTWKHVNKIKSIKYWIDSSKFKIPLIKIVLYPLYVSRFTRSLSLLVASGVPLVQSLDVAKETVVNLRIEYAVDEIKKQVTEGGTLYDAFKSTHVFPLTVVEMIGIGESTGKLQHILENISDQLEEEVDYAITKFITLLEPILVIFVGGIVLTVFLGIYFPIFAIQGALRGM